MPLFRDKINHIIDLAKKPSKKGYIELLDFLKDKNKLVRYEALEVIYECYEIHVKKEDILPLIDDSYPKIVVMAGMALVINLKYKSDHILKKLLLTSHKIKDELLLTDIIECLHQYDTNKINYSNIEHLFKSKSYLVRGYLYSYLPFIIGKERILEALKKEKSGYIKVALFDGLCQIGQLRFIDDLINIMLQSRQRNVVFTAANSLVDNAPKEKIFKVKTAFKFLLRRKPELARIASIQSKLEKLNT